jgi:hypothetical protein
LHTQKRIYENEEHEKHSQIDETGNRSLDDIDDLKHRFEASQ